MSNANNNKCFELDNRSSNSLISAFSSTPSTHPIVTTTTADDDASFTSVLISDSKWDLRLHDLGCAKDALPRKAYKRKQIPPIGFHGMDLYYNLTAITIDYIKLFATEYTLGRCWEKVSKNKSDAKVKIIGVLLAIRKEDKMGFLS